MYDIFLLSIYCTVKPTTTYTFISQKKPRKKSDLFLFYKLKLVYSISFIACGNDHKRGKKLLIGRQYSERCFDWFSNLNE